MKKGRRRRGMKKEVGSRVKGGRKGRMTGERKKGKKNKDKKEEEKQIQQKE